jgi:SAM-dependent methyltransferase/GNAT superfamily N-acetyltransferase
VTEPVTNVFAHEAVAARYAQGRIPFHPAVIERIGGLPGVGGGLGLDVGCGTGMSSLALAVLCRRVVALDSSSAMLGRLVPASNIDRVVACAERLPLRDAGFDVITLSQVLHWLDASAFLSEARRVLRPGGWLVGYDHHLAPEANGDAAFAAWLRGPWVGRHPPPRRHRVDLERAETWSAGGFVLERTERFQTTETWSPEALVDFLVSQSAVAASVEVRGESIEAVRAWTVEATRPFFGGAERREFAFEVPIACATVAPALVEPASVAHVSQILPLMEEFNAFEGIPWKPETMVPALERLLADSAIGFGLLARDPSTGALVGYGLATMGYDVEYGGADAFVTELFVAPSWRGRGIGRMLLDAIVAALEARGACAIHLMVRPENVAAHALYSGRGFRDVPRLLMTRPTGSRASETHPHPHRPGGHP